VGAYLQGADELGADVIYVLTRRRERLSEADAELLSLWRSASAQARAAAIGTLSGAHNASDGTAKTTFYNATIGQQISGSLDLREQKIIVKPVKGTRKTAR